MWFGNSEGGTSSTVSARIDSFHSKVKNTLQKFNLEGWLKKRGEKGVVINWKKRWFFLKEGKLLYSKEEGENPIGHIDLRGRVLVSIPDHNFGYEKEGNNWGFQITTESREWLLMAPSEKELQRWMNGLKVVLRYTVTVTQPKLRVSVNDEMYLDWVAVPDGKITVQGDILFSNVHLLLVVASYVDNPQTLCSLASINHFVYQLSKSDSFWLPLFERKFGTFVPIRRGASVKSTYRTLLSFEPKKKEKKSFLPSSPTWINDLSKLVQ